MDAITEENYKELDHISDEELKHDIADIIQENKDFQDEKDILERNPERNKLRIYMLSGHILANEGQLRNLRQLYSLRNL